MLHGAAAYAAQFGLQGDIKYSITLVGTKVHEMDTTMQVIVSLAGVASGVPSAWTNLDAWKRISTLVDEYTEMKTDLENIEMRYGSRLRGLAMHRARIQTMMPRLQTAVNYYGDRLAFDPEAPGEYSSTTELIDTLTEAIIIIDTRIRPLEEETSKHKAGVDRALTALLKQLHEMDSGGYSHSDSQIDVTDFEATEDIALPETLDIIEEELAIFEQKRQANDQSGATPEVFRVDPEIVRRDREEIDLLNTFGDCKSRQRQLQARMRSDDEDEELIELERQIAELGHQLALLGVPIKDNSIVSCSVAYDPSDVSSMKVTQHENPEVDYWGRPYEEGKNQYDVQRGLFDDDQIERPNAGMETEDYNPPTQAEIRYMLEKLQTRIYNWMDANDDSGDGSQEPEELPTVELSDSQDLLVELTPEDSITRILAPAQFSASQLAVLESRRRAWAVQLSRDRKETALRIETEDYEIERPPQYEEWLE